MYCPIFRFYPYRLKRKNHVDFGSVNLLTEEKKSLKKIKKIKLSIENLLDCIT
jgi:hypothetical protein